MAVHLGIRGKAFKPLQLGFQFCDFGNRDLLAFDVHTALSRHLRTLGCATDGVQLQAGDVLLLRRFFGNGIGFFGEAVVKAKHIGAVCTAFKPCCLGSPHHVDCVVDCLAVVDNLCDAQVLQGFVVWRVLRYGDGGFVGES